VTSTPTDVTYSEVGATRGPMPAGYRHVERREPIGHGEALFTRAAEAIMTWRVLTGAGVTPVSVPPRVTDGALAEFRLGPPGVGIRIPCRVVYTVDEPRRRGFAYGTRPGHLVHGEEAFLVDLADDGTVWCTIRAFSRPARRLFRLAGPLGPVAQRLATARYIRAVRRAAAAS
jgi:uncharacterized protein (UPF0548 family)